MPIRSDFLKRGYLPENLPPVFVSTDFGRFAETELGRNEYLTRSGLRTKPSYYNATKRGHQRRLFSIPNPIAAADTCLFLDQHWNHIEEHIGGSSFSASKPRLDHLGPRAISITPHDELAILKLQRLAGSKYIATTDISRFFPSIYTHALPWAFHGRGLAKGDTNPRSRTVFFNRIDFILRHAQDGQTIGIPIGPDSSRVVSEVLAAAIDKEFARHVKGNPPQLIRHVDDIWIGTDSQDDAERLLYTYRGALREFELDINELKTSITPATHDLMMFWPKEVSDMLRVEFGHAHGVRRIKTSGQILVLDKIFELANRHRDDGIIKLALRRLDDLHAWSRSWEVLQPFLLRCLVNYPHSVDYVARVLCWRRRIAEDIHFNAWQAALNRFVGVHASLRNDSEVCWALWLMKELGISLRKQVAERVAEHCGPLPLMMLFGCIDAGLVRAVPKREDVVQRLGDKPLSGAFWVFAYEAERRGWLRDAGIVGSRPHEVFELMKRKNVSFFNPDALPLALEGREEEDWDDAEAIEDIAGEYEDDEDDFEEPFRNDF